MSIVASTSGRVPANTSPEINDRIERDMQMRLMGYANQPPLMISVRLRELDEEWDIERCLGAGFATIVVAGTALAAAGHRKWLALPAAVAGFFMQHTLQGWCPPLPLFRALGIRTADEINRERYALKALRGDFQDVTQTEFPEEKVELAIEATAY